MLVQRRAKKTKAGAGLLRARSGCARDHFVASINVSAVRRWAAAFERLAVGCALRRRDTAAAAVDGGQGRAINITYVDTGGVMQTEFNVALPWSKEVSLSAPAKGSASVAVVNVGRDVTCSVSVNGTQIRQRSGRGLTICTGAA